MADKLLKSVVVAERYSENKGTFYRIELYESGSFGRKRSIKVYYYQQTEDIEQLRKEYVANDYPTYEDNEFVFLYLKDWIKDEVFNNKTLRVKSETITFTNSNYSPVNETDQKFILYMTGFAPVGGKSYPSIEIIQDPYDPNYFDTYEFPFNREFSFFHYYLNNGVNLFINWTINTISEGGNKYSDNWGREMDIADLTGGTSKKNTIEKNISAIYSPENSLRFNISPSGDLIYNPDTYVDGNGNKTTKSWSGLITDKEIIDEIITAWKKKDGIDLKICDEVQKKNFNEKSCQIIPFKDPISTITTNPETQTGASQSTVIATETFVFDVSKENTFVSSKFGELTLIGEEEAQFLLNLSEQINYTDMDMLDSEYQETEFVGDEEEIFNVDYVDTDSLNSLKGFDPNNPDDTLSTDSSSKYPVSKDKDKNIKEIIKAAKSAGVTNKYAITAILSIVSKESGFIPRGEVSYRKTSAERIKKIFKSMRKYSDTEVDQLKMDDKKFFDIIYGGKFGNANNEGFKFRGRGFNQITFRGNYETYAKNTKLDIVGDPDSLNKVDVAAACVVSYMKNNISKAPDDIKTRYNFTNINSFKNLDDAVGAMYHANAGWGKSYSEVVADSTGGRKKAFQAAGPLYNTYKGDLA